MDTRTDLEAVAQGDTTAILTRNASLMLATALAVLGNREDAEDAVQDASLRVWRHLGHCSFTHPAQVVAWLRTVTERVAIDQARHHARRPTVALYPTAAESVPARGDVADQAIARTVLWAALAAMPSLDQRDVLVRTDLAGSTPHDYAAETGVKVATVKTRHCRGLRNAATALTEMGVPA